MIRRYYVQTAYLKEGMRMGQSITDRLNRVLIARGSILNGYLIQSLKKLNISGVYIQEGEEIHIPLEEKLPTAILYAIEKNKVPDPAKVHISESVKERVAEGVRYLYNNSSVEEFAETSDQITRDLMQAIDENDALADPNSALFILFHPREQRQRKPPEISRFGFHHIKRQTAAFALTVSRQVFLL